MKAPILFGKYLLLERINVGGMAEVFIAKAFGIEGFERVLAVKKILPTMAADNEFITMFIDEARISVQLNHANIVHIHELGKHDDSFYIAMEYVSGPDLRSILDRFRAGNARMPIAQAAYIASKICEGLDYAHRKKDGRGMNLDIIHRDVSPQNVLISYEGEVKIIDFGIAKAANRTHQTQAGILKGKFAYMSPEQVQGRQIDRRSDIFAVGNILFEMLTGERLFVGGSDFSVVEKVRNAEVPSVREIDPEIPTGLEQILYRSLAREPTERYQWASEMQEDLLRFQLVGDTIYSSKNLSVFMKEAFAEDLQREHGRMERFTSMQKPVELEPSAVTQSPFSAPPRGGPPVPKQAPDARPAARRGPSPHQANVAAANVAAAAMGVEEPSISVDPSLPSFQLPPGDTTAVNEKQGATDTFITPEPQKEHRRVGRGEKVEIGAERDDLIDAPTYPRPAYAGASARPAQAPVNGKRAKEEPPPWPSMEGRGETVIQQGPPPRPPARREGPGRHVTPKPSPSPGPRSPPVLAEAPVSNTDINGVAAGRPPETGEWAEDPAVSRTVADMPAVSGAQARGGGLGWLGDDALPEPPKSEIPSVTNVEIPGLEQEPKTTAGTGGGHDLDTRTNTDAIPLPAPERAVTDQAVPLPVPAIPLPAPGDVPPLPAVVPLLPDIPLPKVSASQAIPLPSPNQDAVTTTDAPSTAPRDIRALEEQSLTPTPTPQDLDPNSDAAALASTALRGVADDDEESELGPDEKTLARDIPELEEIRRRAAAEEDETLSGGLGAKTEMRAPQGWSSPEEDTAPPATLGAQHQRNHTPVEGWDEKGGTSADRAYVPKPAAPITNPGSTTGEMTEEDEPPAWPSLEGRGETFIGQLPEEPSPPPKKRPASSRGVAAKGPPAPSSPRPKTGNFVVGRMDDSPSDEPSTSAERPRVLPPGGRSSQGSESRTSENVSVVTDLPAERSDPQLPPYRPSATRGSLVVGPPPIDRRKLLVVGGAAVAALSLVITLAMVFTGSSTEPVWINITPAKASIQVDGQSVKNSEVANLKAGDHELTATAPGFRPLKRRLTVSKRTPPVTDFLAAADGSEPAPPPVPHFPPAPPRGPDTTTTATPGATGTPNVPSAPNKGAPSIPIPPPVPGGGTTAGGAAPAIPKLFVAVFETEEPDVEVSIGAKAMGKTPGLRLTGMTVGKDYSYVAKKAGFKTAFGKFRSDGQAEINIPLTLEKAPEKEPGVAAVPGTGTGAPPPPKRLGELACATKPQGAQIFVDGKPTGRTTPATPSNPIHVPAGKHKITFKLGAKSVDKMIDVKPGEMERLTNIDL